MKKPEKLRYAILKSVSEGNTPLTEADFSVEAEKFDEAVKFLTREKYLIGVFYADNRPHLHKIGPTLTEKGEIYLKKNSLIGKSYIAAKEIKNWIK